MSDYGDFKNQAFRLQNSICEMKCKMDNMVDLPYYQNGATAHIVSLIDNAYMDIDNAKTRIDLLIEEIYKK